MYTCLWIIDQKNLKISWISFCNWQAHSIMSSAKTWIDSQGVHSPIFCEQIILLKKQRHFWYQLQKCITMVQLFLLFFWQLDIKESSTVKHLTLIQSGDLPLPISHLTTSLPCSPDILIPPATLCIRNSLAFGSLFRTQRIPAKKIPHWYV